MWKLKKHKAKKGERTMEHYEVKDVSEWVVNDETLTDKFGY